MEQLQQVYVLLLVECDGRGDVLCAESGVTAVNDLFQVCGGDLGGRDVEGEYLEGELLKGVVLPLGGPVAGKLWNFLWNKKTAVGGKTLEDDVLEGELKRVRMDPLGSVRFAHVI